MCGIVGFVADEMEDIVPFLMKGLKYLEYRGYDSAGISALKDGQLNNRRRVGKLYNLEEYIKNDTLSSYIGIAHTRWATHGRPTEKNCHPISSQLVSVVHNGIIENYRELKVELKSHGYEFYSDTDTEIITAILSTSIKQGYSIDDAFAMLRKKIQGHYSIAFVTSSSPHTIYAIRKGCPLCIGTNDAISMIASDAVALSGTAKKICYLEDGDYAIVTKNDVQIFDKNDNSVIRDYHMVSNLHKMSDKGNYKHYMLKEIHEQPEVINQVFGKYVNSLEKTITLPDLPFDPNEVSHIVLCGCGTAYYAALIAKFWFEKYSKINVSVEVGSELRYTEMPLKKDMLGIFISQSGETLDTLAAMRKFKHNNVKVLTVVNVPQSTIMREADAALEIYAGQEIGVASTKAMMCQLTTLVLFSIQMGLSRGVIDKSLYEKLVDELYGVPRLVNEVIANEKSIADFAKKMSKKNNIIYIGRHITYPLALEGALKLKEISYIHAEGYIGGELKHGPLALLGEEIPIVALAPKSVSYEKTISNVAEAIARGGELIFISDEDVIEEFKDSAIFSIKMPKTTFLQTPFAYLPVLQLLAYYNAVVLGTDVDQPRNLAKSVTVE